VGGGTGSENGVGWRRCVKGKCLARVNEKQKDTGFRGWGAGTERGAPSTGGGSFDTEGRRTEVPSIMESQREKLPPVEGFVCFGLRG